MQIYWSRRRHETLRRDKSAPRRQTDSPAVWDSGWEPVFVQGMGIGAGLAAVQWPVIGGASRFWAWHTAGEIGCQSSTCMFGQLFAWTPLKGEAPPQQSIDFCTRLGDIGRLVFCGLFVLRGKWNLLKHFQLQRGIVFLQRRIWVDGQRWCSLSFLKGIYIYKEWELWLGCQSKLLLRKKLLYNESLSTRLWVRI